MEALDQVWFGNTLGAWIAAGATAVGGVGVLFLARMLLLRWLPPVAKRTPTTLDDKLVAVIRATKSFFVFLFPLLLGLGLLSLGATADLIVGHLRTAVVIFQIGFWISAGVSKWAGDIAEKRATKDKAGVTSISVLRIALIAVLWVMTMLIMLDNLGVDVMTLIAGLGVGGVAIALAVQGILSDLVASVVIVLDKPFVIGDAISVGDISGTVESIGLKTTRLRSPNGEEIVCSHSDLIGSRIRNYRTQRERRVQFTLGVTYDTVPEKLAAIPGLIKDIVLAGQGEGATEPAVRFDRSHVSSYGESSIVVETAYIVLSSDYGKHMDLHQRVLLDIHRAFAREGIAFAFPTRTVHVDMQRGDDGARERP